MNRAFLVFIALIFFIIGFLASYIFNFSYFDIESPYFFSAKAGEQPGNWVKENQIEVFPDKIIIHIQNALLSRYADTGSMLPTLGENANGIKIIPKTEEQIQVGDIITYKKGTDLIVHRVIAKGKDEKGIFFIAKGDNNTETDGKIYFEDIKYVTVALIY